MAAFKESSMMIQTLGHEGPEYQEVPTEREVDAE